MTRLLCALLGLGLAACPPLDDERVADAAGDDDRPGGVPATPAPAVDVGVGVDVDVEVDVGVDVEVDDVVDGDEGEGEVDAGPDEGPTPDVGEGEGEGEAAPGFFFAVGYGGRRMTSLDGTTWQNDQSDVDDGGDDNHLLRDACSGDGVYLAVGGSSQARVLSTLDGVTYESFVDDRGWLGGCAYGDGVFVAVGSDRSIRSLDGGVTWTDPTVQRVNGRNWQARDIAFGAGRFVAAGDEGVSTSVDGINWSSPTGPSVEHVAFGDGVWIALGDGSRGRSTDGVTWTFTTGGGRDVVHDGQRFVSVGNGVVQTSRDGLSWQQTSGPSHELLAHGGGVYVTATWSNRRRASSDLVTWREVGDDGGNALASIVFGDPAR